MKKILFILAAMVLSGIGLHAGNTITYTATEKLPGDNGTLDVGATTFGPAITSHDFSNGIGTITCAGEITRIERFAFRNCRNLTSIEVPNPVKWIDLAAFQNCTSLTSIEFPSSITSIGPNAFYNCTSLISVKVNWTDAQSIISIYSYVFNGIANGAGIQGATLYVPVGTINLYKQANVWKDFGCISIPRNTIAYTATAQLFGYNGSLNVGATTFGPAITSHTFSNGTGTILCAGDITKIDDQAFSGCTGLMSIDIPISLTTIGQYAFFETGLTSITIPASVKEIGAWAFKNCTQLKDLQFADRTDAINIGIYAFENMALTEAIIPDWMTDISEGLFFNNTKLTAIYLPEQVNTIGHRPFGACPLEYIISMSEMPPALPVGEAFEGYNKDASVIVYVPSMDAVAAYQKSDWNKYFTNFITNNTYRILSASSGTAELVSVIPDEKEKTISIPSVIAIDGDYYRVIGIGDEAFKDNTVLQSISLPPTIQYIGNSAFSGCTQLKQTNSRFWEDLQTIGDAAFYGCSALDSIVIPEGVQTIGKSAFMGCSKLTSISLPTGLKNIPDECFKQCPLGQEIIVPEGVETIGKSAFEGTNEAKMNAESLTLPSTLKEINFAAFFFHDGLKGVTCLATTPPTLKDQVFAEYQYQKYKHDSITVYVPNRDVMAAYRDNKNQWGSDLYNFKFSDLMAEENKAYLNTVAGNNDEAKNIAALYCDSIDRANSAQEVQDFTNNALDKIDKLTLEDYKKQLIDSLKKTAGENIEAQQIVEQYKTQIENAYLRQDAEQLFNEAKMKINGIFELIALKNNYILKLNTQAEGDPDLQQVAKDYSNLIQLAETKEEVEALYLMAELRITRNKQIKEDWKCSTKVNNKKCSTTEGYK